MRVNHTVKLSTTIVVLRPTGQVIDEFPDLLWVPRVSTALLFEVCIPQGFGQFSCSLSGHRELLT